MEVLPKEWRVLISRNHCGYSTHAFTLLNSDGKVAGEYWHNGHLSFRALADLDGDGKEELLLAGVNNTQGQATLVVLDLDKLTPSVGPNSISVPLDRAVELSHPAE